MPPSPSHAPFLVDEDVIAGPVIASVPSDHVYVRHIAPLTGPAPIRLPDRDPDDPSRVATARWWPPVLLEPAWAAAGDFDLYHLQFGFDACSLDQLTSLVETLRSQGRPLVYTVHDLRNPHFEDRESHDRQLDLLVPAADALITLTEGAAAEIERRWGRRATVIPHPHVVDLPTMAEVQATRAALAGPGRTDRPDGFRVGLHLKSLRASMDALQVLPTLVEILHDLPDGVLQVNAHHDVFDVDGIRHDAALVAFLQEASANGDLELQVHDYLEDAELWEHLASLDASVLPYRFGTHSGWLEACRDLGTTVIAPTCGYFAEQGPVLSYGLDESSYDAGSLADAVLRAYETRPAFGATVEGRREQRQQIAEAHADLYRSLLA